MIESGGKNLWFVRSPLSIAGIHITSIMTIVKTTHDQLILISPVEINASLKSAIEELGTVAWIVAPNEFHHLFITSAKAAFPEAKIRCTSGLPKKIKSLPEHSILNVNETQVWGDDLEVLQFYPGSLGDEYIFYHSSSQTLILTDLFMWFEGEQNLATKLFSRLMSANGDSPKMSLMMKLIYRDKTKLRNSFAKMLEWDFKRVHLAHNRNIETDAKRHIINATRFAEHSGAKSTVES